VSPAPSIRVTGLSKHYRLGTRQSTSLREAVNGWAAQWWRPRGTTASRPNAAAPVDGTEGKDGFWALKDVSFETHPGDVIGVIGRNGAGKSTLLKIMSRITAPTHGRIELRGRVASLLEVGTGFHPELTGRENVYLNGTILGMTRPEIARRFDEIVDFAEIERFIDTPVKRYSSGMYVRLAFAVAAHLESEILIVDEVLAVGDAAFQEKCLGKMDRLGAAGRTLLFVSHNLSALHRLTKTSLLLVGGQKAFLGPTSEAIAHHLQRAAAAPGAAVNVESLPRVSWAGDRSLQFVELELLEQPQTLVDRHVPIRVRVRMRCQRPVRNFRLGMTLGSLETSSVASGFSPAYSGCAAGQMLDLELSLMNPGLAPGNYHITLGINQSTGSDVGQLIDFLSECLAFRIQDGGVPDVPPWNPGWGAILLDTRAVLDSEATVPATLA
jgi:lipopolysaccharide transport system ATP-binding protein